MTAPTSFHDIQQTVERGEIFLTYRPIVPLFAPHIVQPKTILTSSYYLEITLMQTPSFDLNCMSVEETAMLEDWMLQEACRQLYVWHKTYPSHNSLMIGINLSDHQFLQPDLVEKIEQALEATSMNTQCLVLEINESTLLKNFIHSISVLEKLHQKKIQVTVDHFGTGYSSLKHLKNFQCQNLKLDRSFVERLKNPENFDNLWFSRLVTELAETLSMRAIADGVETKEHLKRLSLLRCPYVQGGFVSKPLTTHEIENLLNQSTQDTSVISAHL
ncbi:MAG: EAL domain-containing protein [Oculatellaceae cyanobacterium bins.114]|nr:EAL domain-containing protein [Oculatellaceae cyanobacterium bins.114]